MEHQLPKLTLNSLSISHVPTWPDVCFIAAAVLLKL
jgi:hypothetical protein